MRTLVGAALLAAALACAGFIGYEFGWYEEYAHCAGLLGAFGAPRDAALSLCDASARR